ncbi:MAG: TetR/AcrR family transcriptional regulator [Faecalibacterium sp.]|nr:TetR/AcrR family transcriptional regulator [Faecalibacterium sp.]
MGNPRKEVKRQNLMDSAYTLFLEKGTLGTTISDIVQRADVAKGTFYLYFKDKDDIFHALVERISARVVSDAARAVQESGLTDFSARVIFFADCIIEYFKTSPTVLRLLDRHFSWPRLEHQLATTTDPVVLSLIRNVLDSPAMQGRTEQEMWHLVFVLTEMVGATCYSSIIEMRPAPIDEMKPILYNVIRAALRPQSAEQAPTARP